jgi:hypothetical protein
VKSIDQILEEGRKARALELSTLDLSSRAPSRSVCKGKKPFGDMKLH